jgi:adenylate cyclase
LLSLGTGGLALGIFVFDTESPLQFAVAVLYVFVILIAAGFLQRCGVLIVATSCAALTLLSFLLAHGLPLKGTAPIRCVVSLAAIGITTLLALRNLAVTESLRQTERHRANLARFFSPRRVDQLMEIDTPLAVVHRLPAAVLFVDMVGFSTYCASAAPDAVIALLRDLSAVLSRSVFAHDGTIDKFLGDGLMAVFGAPIPSGLDATNVARCAIEMLHAVERWNHRRQHCGDAAVRLAIGIHYGEVIQGDVGSDQQLELTVVGDPVNIASRVEAYCRQLDAPALVTASFLKALNDEGDHDLGARFVDQGWHMLRGRSEPVRLHAMIREGTGVWQSQPVLRG